VGLLASVVLGTQVMSDLTFTVAQVHTLKGLGALSLLKTDDDVLGLQLLPSSV